MPVTDALTYLHGSGTSAFGPVTNTAGVYGDALCYAGSQYSNLEIDFGAPTSSVNPGSFPSLTEKGYTFPPELPGNGGVEMGLHVIVGSAFNLLTSINFEFCTSLTTGALYTASPNPVAARTLTLAQLAVVGAHYYIPIQLGSLLEFNRFYAALTGTDPTTGTILAWFGPRTGGEQ